MTGLPLPASSCDRLLGASGATPLTGAEAKAASGRIAELPVGDLVKAWRVAMTTRLSAQTPAIQLFDGYFDGLGERDPDRALDFIAALDRDEPDDALFMPLADRKILGQLVLFHLPKAIDPLCELARKSPRLRIALGLSGVPSGIDDIAMHDRLQAAVDEAGTRNLYAARDATAPLVDFSHLTLGELAEAWLTLSDRSPVEVWSDRAWLDLQEHVEHLLSDDPDRVLALIVAILNLDVPLPLFSLLAAGPLEDLIPEHDGPMVHAIVTAAEHNTRLRQLLGGVWCGGKDAGVVARLKAVTDHSVLR